MNKIALKRLTKSDLTFFIWHFENENAGNQKAINLNADVFIGELFPSLPEEALRREVPFSIDLNIYGPGLAPALNLQRKIMKGDTYKNWRLNGEFVFNDPTRFKPLSEGDLALIEFEGDDVPFAARMVLLARSNPEDAEAHKVLDKYVPGGRKSMVQMRPSELSGLLNNIKLTDGHPLQGVNLESELEDAAQGGLKATQALLTKRTTRKISRAEFKAARNKAEENGLLGEQFVNEYLDREKAAGHIRDYCWTSNENPIAPFDFEIVWSDGSKERLDVKSTTGVLKSRIHISMNELLHMADKDIPYRIYRIYEIDETKAKMRITDPLSDMAAAVVKELGHLPTGFTADGVTVDTGILKFGSQIDISLDYEDGE